MNNNLNPDIQNNLINRDSSHTSQISTSSKSVGGRRRKYKSIKYKKSKLRRKYKSKRHRKSRKQRKSRRQRGGLNPTYSTYSTSLEPGVNGMYANGPSVGKIIQKFN
jgi:hypothetical protein